MDINDIDMIKNVWESSKMVEIDFHREPIIRTELKRKRVPPDAKKWGRVQFGDDDIVGPYHLEKFTVDDGMDEFENHLNNALKTLNKITVLGYEAVNKQELLDLYDEVVVRRKKQREKEENKRLEYKEHLKVEFGNTILSISTKNDTITLKQVNSDNGTVKKERLSPRQVRKIIHGLNRSLKNIKQKKN